MSPIGRVAGVLSLTCLAVAGILAWKVNSANRAVSSSLNLLEAPRHPVNDPMWRNARAVAGKPAPNFTLLDVKGRPVMLTDLCKKGPVVLVFTKDGCPCSMESQPFFNQLAKGFEGKATFVGVIDGPDHIASKYADDFKVPYPMLQAGDGAVFVAYRSLQSVYTTLVGSDGVVVKQWPGYNKAMLIELDEDLAIATKSKAIQLDTSMAPTEMNSGCFFKTTND